jgi:hypothetical protein
MSTHWVKVDIKDREALQQIITLNVQQRDMIYQI